jgi:hypothetical protein
MALSSIANTIRLPSNSAVEFLPPANGARGMQDLQPEERIRAGQR